MSIFAKNKKRNMKLMDPLIRKFSRTIDFKDIIVLKKL